MNTADRELIVGMIAETLSPEESEAAQLRLESDPAFRAAHAEQVAVRSRLADVGSVSMTADERSALRAALTDQLSLDAPRPVATAPATRRSFRLWQPIAGLAAVAAVVAAFVVLPGALSGEDSDGIDNTATAEFTEQAPDESLGAESDGADIEDARPQDLFAEGELVDVLDTSGATIDDLVEASEGGVSPGEVQRSLKELGYESTVSIDGSAMEQCLHQAQDTFPEGLTGVVLLGAEKTDGTVIAHFGLRFADGIKSGLSIDLDGCTIITNDE